MKAGVGRTCLAPALLAGMLFAATARAATLCTVLADASSGKVMYQKGDCAKRVTPACTFKIAISLMGCLVVALEGLRLQPGCAGPEFDEGTCWLTGPRQRQIRAANAGTLVFLQEAGRHAVLASENLLQHVVESRGEQKLRP